jgi:hypothetical protein
MMKRKKERASHTFAGEQEGTELAQWLNNDGPRRIGSDRSEHRAESRTRTGIAQLIQDLNVSAETFIREGRLDAALNDRIERQLSRYTLKVKTVHVEDEGKYKTFAEPKWTFGWYSRAGARAAEMIFGIVRLGERGLLARVRRCDRCDRWFYAKFNHQRFCGKKCQLQHYQTSEEWKRRRRERYQNR